MKPEIQLLLLLAILIFASKVAGHLCQRYLRQPIVFGEILAGLLLGPTLLNIYGWPVFTVGQPFSPTFLKEIVEVLAGIGVLLLMFVAGLETNLGQMRRVGVSAFVTATCGVVFPLGLGMLAALLFGVPFAESSFIGVVLTATSVSITAQTLMEIRQLRSKEGTTILGAAVIDDVQGIILLSFIIAFSLPAGHGHQGNLVSLIGGGGAAKILLTVLGMALFFLAAIVIGKYGLPGILRLADRIHASHAIPAAALLMVLLFAVGAEYIGQVAAITGAYLAGVFLARTPYHKQIEQGIHPFTYAFFVPIFFMSIGLDADARSLAGGTWLFVVFIILIAIISKILGCGLGARFTGNSNREAIRIGIGMVSRGEVGLIITKIGQDAGIFGPSQFAVMVIMVLATTILTPVLLRLSFPRRREFEVEVYESVAGIEGDEDRESV